MVWNIGNTTVRNPNRIQDGLILFAQEFNGNLDGKVQEKAFWNRLIDLEIVDKDANRGSDWNGRKWRSCFVKLGFITGKRYKRIDGATISHNKLDQKLNGLSGNYYELTPIGKRLVEATTQGEIEDIFLRQLYRLEVPSPTEQETDCQVKPLILILQVLNQLSKMGEHSAINRTEIAAFIQTAVDHSQVDSIAQGISAYRKQRSKIKGRNKKRGFDKDTVKRNTQSFKQKWGTFKDYADTTFRYTRLTGLFSISGTRLTIQEQKQELVSNLIEGEPEFLVDEDPLKYLLDFYTGTRIPTDNQDVALRQVQLFEERIREKGYTPKIASVDVQSDDAQTLAGYRYVLEDQYKSIREDDFAKAHFNDVNMVSEVIKYLKELQKRRQDPELSIDDAPSYLEWSVWRALLTLNHLSTHPGETRRFKIDMDLRPISHAPGGGADMIMRYDDFFLVAEVTLMSGSRQEAAEGESVRRHVAKVITDENNDNVVGVFVAPKVDINTADIFQRARYYVGDKPVETRIIPMTIDQLILVLQVVKNGFASTKKTPSDLYQLMDTCFESSKQVDAPTWLNQIDDIINQWAV